MEEIFPVVIEQMIKNVQDTTQNVHARQSYYLRLVSLKEKLEKVVKQYEDEMIRANRTRKVT